MELKLTKHRTKRKKTKIESTEHNRKGTESKSQKWNIHFNINYQN